MNCIILTPIISEFYMKFHHNFYFKILIIPLGNSTISVSFSFSFFILNNVKVDLKYRSKPQSLCNWRYFSFVIFTKLSFFCSFSE